MAARNRELIKVVCLGDAKQGKTQLVARACKGLYSTSSRITVAADFEVKQISSATSAVTFQLWSMPGDDKYQSPAITFYHETNIGVLCILANQILDTDARQKLTDRLKEFREQTPEVVPCILVITKCDETLNAIVAAPQIKAAAEKFVTDQQLKTVIYTSAKENYFGDGPVLPQGPRKKEQKISDSFCHWLYERYLSYKQSDQAKLKNSSLSQAPQQQPAEKKSSNSFIRFVSRNRWELAIGLGLMLSLGLFFALYLFIPPAGLVVSAMMLGLMNIGLGLAPSVYIAAFGVPLLAAALGFTAGFFGTKAVRHYACTPQVDNELQDSLASTPTALSKLPPGDDAAEEYGVIGCFSKLRACCSAESYQHQRLNDDRSCLSKAMCP